MEKLFALILALLMLCACGTLEEPIVDEPPEEQTEEPTEPIIEFFTAANGKSGAKFDGKVIIEPEYSTLEIYDDFILAKTEDTFRIFGYDGIQRGFDYDFFRDNQGSDIYRYFGVISEEKVKYIEWYKMCEPILKEAPGEKYYLLDNEGYPLIDIPLESFEIWPVHAEEGTIEILGAADGNYYHGKITGSGKDRRADLEETKPKSYIDEFGYEHTEYQYYPIDYMKEGLNINGEVFLEPIYNRITIPFEDRIILWYSSFQQCLEGGYCKIIDLDKNILNEGFNRVQFTELEDGWYIGIARSAGDMTEDKIFNVRDYMEKGMWFVDKNGKIISPKIQGKDSESAAYYGYDFSIPPITSVNDVITVFDENGKEIEIAIKDYAFKP
ncbi:MAG: hypothetical protein IJO01_03860 [Oscillospiraceae bacterium]|nr:hypothetical protein [Oscillospiraceae bacterium]